MTKRSRAKLATWFVVALTTSELIAAQTPVARRALPAPVPVVFAHSAEQCREQAGGRLSANESYVRTADLNGDGRPDFLLNDEGLDCSTAAALFCGSSGCTHTVLLSAGARFRRVSLGTVREAQIVAGSKPTRLRLALHGNACGRIGAETCYKTIAWDGSRFSDVSSEPGPRP